MGPGVSVIVPTYNRADFLGQALDSLLGQTLPPAQVIVVDDGSTDSTAAIVSAYPVVEYVRTANRGKSAAVNMGLGLVRGAYVWVFDDDDVALPDALARFVAALEANPACGYALSTCYRTASEPDGRLGDVIGEVEAPHVRWDGVLLRLLESSFMAGAQLFVRSSVYREVGGYDERLVRSQDYEMSLRIARRFSGVFVDGGPTYHLRQHGGLRGSAEDRFPAAENEARWRAYDELIFRQVRAEYALEEFLPPGVGLDGRRREAHLRRFGIMAPRLSVAEVVDDLRAVAGMGDAGRAEAGMVEAGPAEAGPLRAKERALLRWGLTREMYGRAIVYSPEFQAEVRRLGQASRTGREMRAEVARAVVASWPSRHWRTAARGLVDAVTGLVRLWLPVADPARSA